MGDAVGNLVASYLGRSTRLTELPLGVLFYFSQPIKCESIYAVIYIFCIIRSINSAHTLGSVSGSMWPLFGKIFNSAPVNSENFSPWSLASRISSSSPKRTPIGSFNSFSRPTTDGAEEIANVRSSDVLIKEFEESAKSPPPFIAKLSQTGSGRKS